MTRKLRELGMAMAPSALPKLFIPDVCHLCGRILDENACDVKPPDEDDFVAPAAATSPGICVLCEHGLSAEPPHLSGIPDLLAFVPDSFICERSALATPPSLIIINSRREVRLPAISMINVGRRDEDRNIYPHVDLTDYGAAAYGVSRYHACIRRGDNGTYIEDLGSMNGTYVNGLRLFPSRLYPLDHGDMICLGRLKLAVKFSEEA